MFGIQSSFIRIFFNHKRAAQQAERQQSQIFTLPGCVRHLRRHRAAKDLEFCSQHGWLTQGMVCVNHAANMC